MVLHTGFGVAQDDAADADDYRLGEAGLIVRSAAGVPRYGVFPPGVSGTGRADRTIDVSSFVAAVGRGTSYGVLKVANVGTEQSPEFSPGPSSNSRKDVLYVIQHDSVDAADADNLPVFGIAEGTAAATPAIPAVPSGAVPLLVVKLPAGANTTNAVGVTIEQIAPFTAAAGGVVHVRTDDELTGWTPTDGDFSLHQGTGVLWLRASGAWVPPRIQPRHAEYTTNAVGVPDTTVVHAGSLTADATHTTDASFVTSVPANSGSLTLAAGLYAISWKSTNSTPVTGRSFLAISPATGEAMRNNPMVGEDSWGVSIPNLFLPAETNVVFQQWKASGGSSNLTGRIRVTKIG